MDAPGEWGWSGVIVAVFGVEQGHVRVKFRTAGTMAHLKRRTEVAELRSVSVSDD